MSPPTVAGINFNAPAAGGVLALLRSRSIAALTNPQMPSGM